MPLEKLVTKNVKGKILISIGGRPFYRRCSINNCIARHEAKGYCHNHYRMFKKHGDPLKKGVSKTQFKRGNKPANYKGIDTCTVTNCGGRHVGLGLCQIHYMRKYHHGNPLYEPTKIKGNAIDRLKAMSIIDPDTGCVLWNGSVDKRGYGRIVNDNGWRDMAHRFSYKYWVGAIPKNKVIHHKCYNTKCVNPRHLEPTTHYENIVLNGKTNAAYKNNKKTECIRGHIYTKDSYWIVQNRYNGARVCKKCHAIRRRKYQGARATE